MANVDCMHANANALYKRPPEAYLELSLLSIVEWEQSKGKIDSEEGIGPG